MPVMRPKSFEGFDLDLSPYIAGMDSQAFLREAKSTIYPIVDGYPVREGSEHQSKEFSIWVAVRDDQSESLVLGYIEDLKQLFRAGRAGTLIIDYDGQDRAIDVGVEGCYPHAGAVDRVEVRFVAADPRLYDPIATTQTASITATGQTVNVQNDGNAAVDDAIIRFTPVTQKAATVSYLYRRYANIVNRVKAPLSDWPIDLTNGGIDHAALVTAGKSTSTGKDVRVLVDGVEVARYFGENAANQANSTALKIWSTIEWPPMREAFLLNSISSSSIGTIGVQRNTIRSWPDKGYAKIVSTGEIISYDGKELGDFYDGTSALLHVERGKWGTSAGSASAGAQLIFMDHKIEIIYGNTNAFLTTPESPQDRKPMLDLTSATLTNLRHEWIEFYSDLYPTRPAQWVRAFEDRDNSAPYIYLPQALSGPAANADFEYNWTLPPTGKDNYNVLRRAIPVGTSGASGQLAFNRVLDSTMMLRTLGITLDGIERNIDTAPLMGPLTSATYSATAGNKFYEAILYARSLVVRSVVEAAYSPLPSTVSQLAQVAGVNASGGLGQMVTNDADEAAIITGVYVMVSEPTTPHRDISISVYPDNGSGAPDTSYRLTGPLTVAAAGINASGQWLGGSLGASGYFPLVPGQKVHVFVETSGTGSNVVWWGSGAELAFRLIGFGPIDENAHGTHGDNATVDNAVILLDSAGVPDFDLQAEQSLYWSNHTLKNNTTGQEISFNLYITPGDQIEVDVGRRTITNLTTGEEGLIKNIDATDWDLLFTLGPGSNELQWDEAGVVRVDIEVTFHARFE